MAQSSQLNADEEEGEGETLLDSLYRRHWRELCRFVRRNFGPGPPEPEDVAQTAFVKLAASPDLHDIANAGAYLRRSARNIVINSHRHAIRTKTVFGSVGILEEGLNEVSAEDVILSKEELSHLNAIIASLPAKHRVALMLQRIDGLSNIEIARRMGISESYVRALIDAAHRQCVAARKKKDLAVRLAVIDLNDQESIEAEARSWARRLASDPNGSDPAFTAWCESDPRHEAAFWDAWSVWRGMADTDVALDESWRAEAAAVAASPRVFLSRLAHDKAVRFALPAAIAASLVAAVALPNWARQADIAAATPVGRTERIALADGSQVTLGARSRVEAFMHGKERRVELADGQAFFEVAKDPARPFIVTAGDAEIRVTGTKFDVKRTGDDVQVSVLEGRVEVRRRGLLTRLIANRPERILTAGLQSSLHEGQGFAPPVAAQTEAGDWRTGRLFYTEVPLVDILADAERYSGVKLRTADADIAHLPLTASFRAGQVDQLVDYVEAALPLTPRRESDGGITFVRRGQVRTN